MNGLGQHNSAGLERPRILCVDDEPHILESLRDTLHRRFDVCSATCGADGLEQLSAEPEAFSVVLSDMRMPAMSGSAFLGEAFKLAPDAAQILLTGYADIQSAISAVNNGRLFRFLTKPCAPAELLAACLAGVEQHRLKTAERVLLEHTLKGSVNALSDVLALANPAAFGRSSSVRAYATRLAATLGVDDGWEIEVAALLAQLGAITLPTDTVEKRYTGAKLSAREQQMVDDVPRVTHKILENIPRLEGVLDILENYGRPYGVRGAGRSVPIGARILQIASDYDALLAHGSGPAIALATLRDREMTYDPDLLATFERMLGTAPDQTRVLEVPLLRLREGMTLADDVRSVSGPLLIARGHVATDQLIARLWNLGPGFVREPLLVIDSQPATSPAQARRGAR